VPNLKPTYTWSGVTGASFYDVWVDDTTAGQSEVLRTQVAATSVVSTRTLVPGDTYQWWVRAYSSAGGFSPWGAGSTFTTPLLVRPVLASPNGAVSAASLQLTWNAINGATAYDIWIDDNTTNQSPVVRKQIAGLSLTPKLMTVGHTYQWWVRALSSDGNYSSWSVPFIFSVT
jgi:hypothetical protein